MLTPSDLFLSRDLSEQQAQQYLEAIGFKDPAAADRNLRALADDPVVRQALGRLADRLLETLLHAPDPDAALVGFSRYLAARSAKAMFLDYLLDDPRALPMLADLLGTSPFLSEILIRNPEYFHWLVRQIERPAPSPLEEDDEIGALLTTLEDAPAVVNALKRLKRRETLRIGVRDLQGRDTLPATTEQLSDLAGVLAECCLAAVSKQVLQSEGRDRLPGTFTVIGMGKLGGRELNYSSDIDLIYVYDPEDQDDPRAHECFHRLARTLTAALGEHTEEGYLYRVDLRLRPMGRRGNVAYSLRQHEQYFDNWGETFERLAYIKARPIAGDAGLGERFLKLVQPFVYRKYLDAAAIEAMRGYKARIDRAMDAGERERNVKAGWGGIREIEVFTQLLQVTYGGHQPELRQRSTLSALEALRRAGLVSEILCDELSRAYVFLRTVEHHLQIVHGSQTHSLSAQAAELDISARRLGFETSATFQAQLRVYRDRVHAAYAGLFESPTGSGPLKGLRFFQFLVEDAVDEDATTRLAEYGFRDPSAVMNAIQVLGQGTLRSQSPSTTRNVLANLLAVSMARLARCARPEQVLTRLEQLTARTGAAALLYRSLIENDELRDALVTVLDSGDLASQRLIRHPELLDSLQWPPAGIATLAHTFAENLKRLETLDLAGRMNPVRRLELNEEFKALTEWLVGGALDVLHEKLSVLADLCVESVARWHASAAALTPEKGAEWAIVALGKLGGRELAVHSDLDLVVLYQGDPADSSTFVRYQSFVEAVQTFFEAPASEAAPYRIDTRLRPEGTKGAPAIPLAAFCHYLDTRAEIWERLAWTRARLLVATPRMAAEIQPAVTRFVYGPWEARIPGYMHDLRLRMERELAHEDGTTLNFKVGTGGLADIDFLLQLIQIREGHLRPDFRVAGTRLLLAHLPANPYVRADEAARLREAYEFLRRLELVARMDADSGISWITAAPDALDPLGIRMGLSERPGEQLLSRYRDITAHVRATYLAVQTRLSGP